MHNTGTQTQDKEYCDASIQCSLLSAPSLDFLNAHNSSTDIDPEDELDTQQDEIESEESLFIPTDGSSLDLDEYVTYLIFYAEYLHFSSL